MDLGRHSGGGLLRHRLNRLNLELPADLQAELLEEIRHTAAARKAPVTDEELKSLVAALKNHHGLPYL
jgi:isopropylmalate/homocitrate/citramalate synthase